MKLMGNQAGLLPEEYDEQVVSRKDQERSAHIVTAIVEKLRNHSKYFEPKTYGVKGRNLPTKDNTLYIRKQTSFL